MNEAEYIGLDVHQATISVAVLDSAGKLVMEAILETKAETILDPTTVQVPEDPATPLILLVASPLCRGQGKRTMRETSVQIGNPDYLARRTGHAWLA